MNTKIGKWKYDEKIGYLHILKPSPRKICINHNKKNRHFIEKRSGRHYFYPVMEVSITSNGKNRAHVPLWHSWPKMYHLLKVTFKKNQLIFFTLAFLANSLTLA